MARAGLRSHFTGSVPISIGVHFIVVMMFLIIPLTATLELPDPAAHLPDYMLVAPPPPPPPAPRMARAVTTSPQPLEDQTMAPTEAPPSIAPETGRLGLVPDTGAIPSIGGDPGGIGVLPGGSTIVVQPPEPPRPTAQVRVADLPVTPRKIGDVRPVYPEIARAAHVQGTVIMEAVLDTTGRVTQLRVIQSAPMLDQAALDAVRQWRYTPSLYGGRPVSVLMTITVRFTLQ